MFIEILFPFEKKLLLYLYYIFCEYSFGSISIQEWVKRQVRVLFISGLLSVWFNSFAWVHGFDSCSVCYRNHIDMALLMQVSFLS